MPNIPKSSLWCSRTLFHELLKSRPLASGEIKKDMTVGTKTLFQDKQKWVWKCPSSKWCIHIIPLKHPDLENGDLAWWAFLDTVDKVARAHPELYVKQYFRGWAGGWMSNLDFVSPYLHYLHQNGPSLALNPLSGEQISLNLYARPISAKCFGGFTFACVIWYPEKCSKDDISTFLLYQRMSLSLISWRTRHSSPLPGFHHSCHEWIWLVGWKRSCFWWLFFFFFSEIVFRH